LHQGEPANAAKLVYNTIAREKGAVGERHMPRKQDTIRQDIVRTQLAIVTDMTVRHEEVFVPNHSVFFQLGRAMYRDVLTENIAPTNAQTGGRTGVFEILRGIPNDRAGMKCIPFSDHGVTCQVHVWTDDATGTQDDLWIDDGIRANGASKADFRAGMHGGEWMDLSWSKLRSGWRHEWK
jgi:hypothetical protein